MHPNVRKLYILNFLAGTVFWYPIEKLFLLRIGASPFGISLNAIVFLLVLVGFDVPAGILADKWKRKETLMLAFASLLVASLIGSASHSLLGYLPMTLFLGAFVVLTQGTFQAMMYDSLEDTNHHKSYDKHQGWSYALFLAGLGVSSLVGGYMSQAFGFRSTYIWTAVAMAVALALAVTLSEPRSHKPLADKRLKEHVLASVKQIVAARLLMQLSLLISATSVLRSAQNEYAGLLFVALGLTAIPIGYATAVKWVASSLGQVLAPKIGRRALKLTPAFFVAFIVFSLIHSGWSLVFFYLAGFLYSVITNQAEAAVQDNTPSEIRATVLSVLTFASNLILVPLSLLFGWIADKSNVFNAYLMIAIVGLVYVAVWAVRGRFVLRKIYASPAHAEQTPTIEPEIV